jgi:type II secretory pathway component PulK
MVKDTLNIVKRTINTRSGVALLIVLWVITILVVLVMSFTLLTRTEANSTVFFRDNVQKKLFAEASLERAIMELHFRQVYKDQEHYSRRRRNARIAAGTTTPLSEQTIFNRLFNESRQDQFNRWVPLR